MVNSITVPCRVALWLESSGAAGWVGPRMKFPSALARGTVPSGNSFASTYPGVCGSRAGGVGRGGVFAGGTACPKAKQRDAITERRRGMHSVTVVRWFRGMQTDFPGSLRDTSGGIVSYRLIRRESALTPHHSLRRIDGATGVSLVEPTHE